MWRAIFCTSGATTASAPTNAVRFATMELGADMGANPSLARLLARDGGPVEFAPRALVVIEGLVHT
jgi:hypothetical protein